MYVWMIIVNKDGHAYSYSKKIFETKEECDAYIKEIIDKKNAEEKEELTKTHISDHHNFLMRLFNWLFYTPYTPKKKVKSTDLSTLSSRAISKIQKGGFIYNIIGFDKETNKLKLELDGFLMDEE